LKSFNFLISLLVSVASMNQSSAEETNPKTKNPYLFKSIPELVVAFHVSALKAAPKCALGQDAALLADLISLTPFISGLSSSTLGKVDPRDENRENTLGLPWYNYGVGTLAAEATGSALRFLAIGLMVDISQLTGHGLPSAQLSDFGNFSGSWAIISSWAGAERKFVLDQGTPCGKELAKSFEIIQAINQNVKTHLSSKPKANPLFVSEEKISPSRIEASDIDATHVSKNSSVLSLISAKK